MREAVVLGVGMTRFGKFLERGLKDLAREAIACAIEDAGVDALAIEAAFGANAVAGLITGQESVRTEVVLRAAGLHAIPVFNVENACASASSAFHLARIAVESGEHDCVLAVGFEKLTHREKRRTFEALATAVDVEEAPPHEASAARSVFMDHYAASARAYMQRYGITVAELAWVSAKNHVHAASNPFAQYRTPMTVEEVLADVLVVDPLTRAMCSPIADGAAAAIVCSPAFARRFQATPVRVLSSVVRSYAPRSASAGARAAEAAYARAGVGPRDVSVFEVHDATASAEMLVYEELGLCAPGEAARLIGAKATALGGAHPVNPSGGLECRGHPVGATGLAQIAELVWQLRGAAGARQVEGARIGLAHNAGGHFGDDNAVCVVTVLGR